MACRLLAGPAGPKRGLIAGGTGWPGFGLDLKATTMTHPAKIISLAIARSPVAVYAFAANPKNLPKWASGLSGAIKRVGAEWVAESPMGKVKIKFAKRNAFGVLDHEVTIESGAVFYNPMRVQPNGQGSEVMFTLYRLPKVSAKSYARDARRVRQDLAKLKSVLEKKVG